jgi:uncharacterized membrane protein (DUF373 family)
VATVIRSDLETGLGHAELAIYLTVAVLLFVAAGFTTVGTIVDVLKASKTRPITDTGVFLLDRILLLFIVAELLYTLRLVSLRGRVLVEPFLFIGLIAVVRRVLVITAQADVHQTRRQAVEFLIDMGTMALLALVLALAIHLLRRSATQQP